MVELFVSVVAIAYLGAGTCVLAEHRSTGPDTRLVSKESLRIVAEWPRYVAGVL